jgi:hypothetical protein
MRNLLIPPRKRLVWLIRRATVVDNRKKGSCLMASEKFLRVNYLPTWNERSYDWTKRPPILLNEE